MVWVLSMNMLKNKAQIILVSILLLHTFILTKLIYFPYPELFIYPYLTNHGLKPYIQIMDQHFPGLLFLPVNLNNLGMTTPEKARIVSIIVVILIHLMLFFIAKDIFKSKTKALFVNLLYLIWQPFFEGWVLWIDSFLPLMLLPAFYAVYKKRFFTAGLLIGTAIVFKQTMIPLAFLILIYTRSLRFFSGAIILPALVIFYLLTIGVFGDFWYWTVVFNLTTYASSGLKTPPTPAYVTRIIFVYAASIFALLKRRKSEVTLLFIFIAGSLLGAFERADFVRLQPSLPFVLLTTVYGLFYLVVRWRWVAVVVYALVLSWWLSIFYRGHLGKRIIAFDPSVLLLSERIKNYASKGEKIFVFGAAPQLYQMSDTLPAGNLFVFQFPWFLKIAQPQILAGLKKDKPNVIISDETVEIEGNKITNFAKEINDYIKKNYEKAESVGTADILIRKS